MRGVKQVKESTAEQLGQLKLTPLLLTGVAWFQTL